MVTHFVVRSLHLLHIHSAQKPPTNMQRSDTTQPHGCAVWVRYHCDVDGIEFRSALFIVTHILLTYVHCGSDDST